jgi:hypothetical protein
LACYFDQAVLALYPLIPVCYYLLSVVAWEELVSFLGLSYQACLEEFDLVAVVLYQTGLEKQASLLQEGVEF